MADENGFESQMEVDQAYEHAQALLKLSSLAIQDKNGDIHPIGVLSLATAILTRAHITAVELMQKGKDDGETDTGAIKRNH